MVMEIRGIEAVVLAGGFGTRLRPVVSDCPKALVAVKGRPFIFYLLDQLADCGIKRVIMCVGYMAAEIRNTVGDQYRDMLIDYSEETTPLGTGGALKKVSTEIESEQVLILNGDSYIDINYSGFMLWHEQKGGIFSIVVTTALEAGRFGTIELAPGGEIEVFVEKRSSSCSATGVINAGVYLARRKFFNVLKDMKSDNISLEREVFPLMIGRGLYGYECRGRFIDIGTPESLIAAADFF